MVDKVEKPNQPYAAGNGDKQWNGCCPPENRMQWLDGRMKGFKKV